MNIQLPHEFVYAPYNDLEDTRQIVARLPTGSLAAILIEPMLGSAGCFAAKKDFLAGLRELATEAGALLIFDEVMTSRLGYHGLGEAMGVKPDMTTLGKWIGGGMSFGAFGGSDQIMGMFDPTKGKLEHPGNIQQQCVQHECRDCRLQPFDRGAAE